MNDLIIRHIEALIFASPQAVSAAELKAALDEALQIELAPESISEAVECLRALHAGSDSAFELVDIAEGYQLMTKAAHHHVIAAHLRQTIKKRLSQAALETLALIAYKQPVSKSELEEIRGVNCDYAIQKLLEKELVVIKGRSEGPGRPLLYGTSERFMDYFGIRSLNDLPKLKDFKETDNSIGDSPAVEEVAAP
ncbi:MAG: SMC-Scp complex subunit ScpB [Saprospiraceae bacterium]